jgi:heme-degrading monooxygenase HmoA
MPYARPRPRRDPGDGHQPRCKNPAVLGFADTPEPPYYAVILTTQRTDAESGYAEMAERMYELACLQPGVLGMEFARDGAGLGITASYWRELADISAWKQHAEHLIAQQFGKDQWYLGYRTRMARVERDYEWIRERA